MIKQIYKFPKNSGKLKSILNLINIMDKFYLEINYVQKKIYKDHIEI